nr:Chain D, MVM NES mutant Nm15 [Minute virus of mice]
GGSDDTVDELTKKFGTLTIHDDD